MKQLPIGIKNFQELILGDYYFVDKTMMIEEFLKSKKKTTIITRPRRFGKTLNMSMLAEFLDITKNSKQIFENTKIMNSDFACHMNQYPILYLSFSECKGTKEDVIQSIKATVLKKYIQHKYVFDHIDELDNILYQRQLKILSNFDSNDLTGMTGTLSYLMEKMQQYYHKNVMVFIDEYDTPIVEAYVGDFYESINTGYSNMLHSALKESDYLQYGLLTGIQRVVKENIFSGLNNPKICDVTSKSYDQYFGFNLEEVQTMLEYYGIDFTLEIKKMYDGYHIGSIDLYNPWSILNYCDTRELKAHWVHTSSNELIRRLLKEADTSFQSDYELLIKNGYLDTIVNLNTSFIELQSDESLWGLFVSAGYLTLSHISQNNYRLKIPNDEVIEEFKSITSYYLDVNNIQVKRLTDSFIMKDKELFTKTYKSILMIPSYYDLKNENSYHMMNLGMSLWLMKDYEVISNKEEGHGRCDIILKAKHGNLPNYILEFKYSKMNDLKELEKLSNEEIQQIKDHQYDYNLTGETVYIGIAHCGKECHIQWIDNHSN